MKLVRYSNRVQRHDEKRIGLRKKEVVKKNVAKRIETATILEEPHIVDYTELDRNVVKL